MQLMTESDRPANVVGLAVVFSAAGILVFSVGLTFASAIPSDLRLGTQLLVSSVLLLGAVVFRASRRLGPYWRVMFAYFIALLAIILSEYTGDWAMILSGRGLDTIRGFTALKLGEDIAIIGVILGLALLSRDRLKELYVAGGRLKFGLTVGISSFLVLAVLGLSVMFAQVTPFTRVSGLLPPFCLIALADGFMEELLFRGLFLKKLGHFVGDHPANLITATVFAFAHLQVDFGPSLPVFLSVVFMLGLFWGWLMKETGSLLAPALFHAGADMLIMRDFLEAFGVRG